MHEIYKIYKLIPNIFHKMKDVLIFVIKKTGLVFMIFLFLNNCSVLKTISIQHKLKGHWVLENVIYEDVKPEMQEEVNKSVQLLLPGSYISFSKKKSYIYEISEYQGKGKWKQEDNFKKIQFEELFGFKGVSTELIELTDQKMTLRYKVAEMYMKLVFVKDEQTSSFN